MSGRESGGTRPVDDFDDFVRRRRNELRASFAVATYLGLDPDDITQETLLRAHRHYRRFASENELLAWSKTVGANLIRRHAGTAYRRREKSHANPLASMPASELPDAEAVAVENVELSRVLGLLPPRQRLVLQLDARGRTDEEIAQELGISGEAARQLLRRARIAAQKSWGKVVAAYVGLAVQLRRLLNDAASPVSAQSVVVASVVSFSMIAVHTMPAARAATPPAGVVVTEQREAADRPPAPAFAIPRATWERAAATVAPRAARPAPPRERAGRRSLLPRLPLPTPTPPDPCRDEVCVAPCGEDTTKGDRIYLKPLGKPCVHVTQAVAPACERVPDNPGIGCEREGDPKWLVEPRRPILQGD